MKKKTIDPKYVIYVTKEGYDQYIAAVNDCKEQLAELRKTRSEYGRNTTEDYQTGVYDTEEIKIIGNIESLCETISRMQIIEDTKAEENLINLGDVVNIQFVGDDEMRRVKIVGEMPNIYRKDGITEISINAPMAQAIYKQPIGAVVSYTVNDKRSNSKFEHTVMIVSKEKALEKAPTQKQPGEEE